MMGFVFNIYIMKFCTNCNIEKEIKNILNKSSKNYYNNREDRIQYAKKYTEENKENIKEKLRIYYREKRLNSITYKVSRNLRSLVNNSLRKCGYKKTTRTFEVIGCDYNEFIAYIESKFEPWMNWMNHGKYNGDFNFGWDIDHIIPISSAKSLDELHRLNHYTNLQPLCSKTNRFIKKDIL